MAGLPPFGESEFWGNLCRTVGAHLCVRPDDAAAVARQRADTQVGPYPLEWARGSREEILDWERGEMFYIGFCMGARLMQEIMECPEFH